MFAAVDDRILKMPRKSVVGNSDVKDNLMSGAATFNTGMRIKKSGRGGDNTIVTALFDLPSILLLFL